jgi:hypothetical protein
VATIKVEVTQADIDKGVRHDPFGCPVALAVRRTIRRRAAVGQSMLYVWFGEQQHDGRLITAVAEFVTFFDAGLPVSPFSFTLNVPAADAPVVESGQ